MYLKITEISAAQRWCWSRKQLKYQKIVDLYYNNLASGWPWTENNTLFGQKSSISKERLERVLWYTPSVTSHLQSAVSIRLLKSSSFPTVPPWSTSSSRLQADMRGCIGAGCPQKWGQLTANLQQHPASSASPRAGMALQRTHCSAQEERRAIQSPHLDITGQVISKFLSRLEKGTTQSHTGCHLAENPAHLQHCPDHAVGCPGHLWIPSAWLSYVARKGHCTGKKHCSQPLCIFFSI